MNYLKRIAKSVYEVAVVDDYIEPLTQRQIYYSLLRTHKSFATLTSTVEVSKGGDISFSPEILEIINEAAAFSLQVQFQQLPLEPTIEHGQAVLCRLEQKQKMVSSTMMSLYKHYSNKIKNAHIQIGQADISISLTYSRIQEQSIRLKKLKRSVEISQSIIRYSIKMNNIKKTLSKLKNIPSINKMTLFELSNIDLNKLRQSSSQLLCVRHIEDYIEKLLNLELQKTIAMLTNCLKDYDNKKYEAALSNFILVGSDTPYTKLLLGLIGSQIRDCEQQGNENIGRAFRVIVEKYSQIIQNMHQICRWHHYNQAASKPLVNLECSVENRMRKLSQLSNQSNQPTIHFSEELTICLDIEQIKQHSSALMDDALAEHLTHLLAPSSTPSYMIYQLLSAYEQLSRMIETFSGISTNRSLAAVISLIRQKYCRLLQDSLQDISQSLINEDNNQRWSRLPVGYGYRHKSIQKGMHIIEQVKQSECYQWMKKVGFYYVNEQKKVGPDSWQINYYQLFGDREYGKVQYERKDYQFQKKGQHQLLAREVVVCQSSVRMVDSMQGLMQLLFYIPIRKQVKQLLQFIVFILQYYIYSIFRIFISEQYANIFFINKQNATIQFKYLHARAIHTYPQLVSLLLGFQPFFLKLHAYVCQHGSSFPQPPGADELKRKQHSIRERVVASESVISSLNYLAQIVTAIMQGQPLEQETAKNLSRLDKIGLQLKDLILADCFTSSSVSKVDLVEPIVKKIRWNKDSQSELQQYVSMLLTIFKESCQRMRSQSKGQIPLSVLEQLLSYYYKHQIIYISLTYLRSNQHSTLQALTASINNFEAFLSTLNQQFCGILVNDKCNSKQVVSAYTMVSKIFGPLKEKEATKCKESVRLLLGSYQFVYKICIGLLECSLGMLGSPPWRDEMDFWIESNVL